MVKTVQFMPMIVYQILFFLSFFCLNLSQAQTQSIPNQNNAAVSTAPTTPTAAPSATSDQTVNGLLSTIKPTAGKYQEYQSICRENEYDLIAYLDENLKNKRVQLIQEKLNQSENKIKFKIRLLKEYLDQKKIKDLEKIYEELKSEKLSSTERIIADTYFEISNHVYKKIEATLSKTIADETINSSDKYELMKLLAEIYTLDNNYFEANALYLDLTKQTKETFYSSQCAIQVLDSQHADASLFCKKAIQQNSNDPFPNIYLGISNREQLDTQMAIQNFKKSIAIRPTEMALTCLGESLFLKKDFLLSSSYFKQSVEFSPKSLRAWLGLAWSEIKNKNFSASLDAFKKACQLDRKVVSELRKAYVSLSEEKSPEASKFIKLSQNCPEE